MPVNKPTRVLIAERLRGGAWKLLADALRKEPDIEVVGGAADPFMARDMILQYEPDLITLDIEMPRMDGLSFLRRLMAHHPIAAIVVSSLTQAGSAASVEALRIGAIDVIAKPGGPQSVGQVTEKLVQRIQRAARSAAPAVKLTKTKRRGAGRGAGAGASRHRHGTPRARIDSVIGASTGGTQALETVRGRLPADLRPILIVQHMPAGFTTAFADRLNTVCAMRVVESLSGGETLERGNGLIPAPGDYHLIVEPRPVFSCRTAIEPGTARALSASSRLTCSSDRWPGCREISVVGLILHRHGRRRRRRPAGDAPRRRTHHCRGRGIVRGLRHAEGGHCQEAAPCTWRRCSRCRSLIFECFERLARMKAELKELGRLRAATNGWASIARPSAAPACSRTPGGDRWHAITGWFASA